MKILFLLQFTSLLSMLINAMLLGLGSLHVRWKNRRYEQSRWMLFAAMLILAAHFLAQMTLSVRASAPPWVQCSICLPIPRALH